MQTSKTAESSLHIQMVVLRQSSGAAIGCEVVVASQASVARFDDESGLVELVLLIRDLTCARHAERGLDATLMVLDGALLDKWLKNIPLCL